LKTELRQDMTVLPLEEYGLLLHLLMDMSRGPQLYHLLLNNEHDLTDEMMALTESIVISYGGIGRLSEFVSGLMYAEIAATSNWESYVCAYLRGFSFLSLQRT